MKRYQVIVVILLIGFITVALCCSAMAETSGNDFGSPEPGLRIGNRMPVPDLPIMEAGSDSSLPASLVSIEDGAFEGTSLSSVTLPENVEEIGDSAFANNNSLLMVTIPGTVERIHDKAFAGSTDVTIRTASGTYAKYWVQRHGLPYVLVPFFVNSADRGPIAAVLSALRTGRERVQRTGVCAAEKKANRTGRPAEEIKLPRYTGNASELVQSRYFP